AFGAGPAARGGAAGRLTARPCKGGAIALAWPGAGLETAFGESDGKSRCPTDVTEAGPWGALSCATGAEGVSSARASAPAVAGSFLLLGPGAPRSTAHTQRTTPATPARSPATS